MERKNRGSFSTLSNRRTRRRCSGVPTCPVHCRDWCLTAARNEATSNSNAPRSSSSLHSSDSSQSLPSSSSSSSSSPCGSACTGADPFVSSCREPMSKCAEMPCALWPVSIVSCATLSTSVCDLRAARALLKLTSRSSDPPSAPAVLLLAGLPRIKSKCACPELVREGEEVVRDGEEEEVTTEGDETARLIVPSLPSSAISFDLMQLLRNWRR
mmetsp:Transcript_74598/g.109397  ORF Transcript_74598/g.109397 Transcript_74598/m.109397 type:complete len:213 (-) Transcript_74598:1040-1678(-)